MSIEDYYYLVRRYRRAILDTSDYLREKLCLTEAAIDEVAAVWDDPQFVKFKEGFQEDKDVIKPLCDDIEEFEGEVLLPLERILRKYLEL